MEKNIYKLDLNESTFINNGSIEVLKVPGGWVYTFNNESQHSVGSEIKFHFTSVFVPFNNEFQK